MANRYWLLLSATVCLVQIGLSAAAVTRPWWYCYGDICNMNGTDQYCSNTYLRCFDCSDIWHRCFTDDMPMNCSNSCKEYILEQQKNAPCQVLNDIANGRHDYDKSNVSYPGDVVRYSCAPGFRLEGPRELKCVGFGLWSSPPPQCIRITCPVLKDVLHGKIIGSNLTCRQGPGTVLKITCLSGYRQVGSDTITCSQNGEWSSALPICLEPTCSALPAVLNGVWSSELNSEFPSGSTVTLHCLGGFTMIGSPVWKCSDQIWVSAATKHKYIPVCINETPVYAYALIALALVVVSVVVTATVMVCNRRLSVTSNCDRNSKRYQWKDFTDEANEDDKPNVTETAMSFVEVTEPRNKSQQLCSSWKQEDKQEVDSPSAIENDSEYRNQTKNETEHLIQASTEGIIAQYNNQIDGSQIYQSKENDIQENCNHIKNDTETLLQKSNDGNIHQNNNRIKRDNDCPVQISGTDSRLRTNNEVNQQQGREKDKHQSNVHCQSREDIVNAEGTNKSTKIQNHVPHK